MATAFQVQALRNAWSELKAIARTVWQELARTCAAPPKPSPGVMASDGFGALGCSESWGTMEPWCGTGRKDRPRR